MASSSPQKLSRLERIERAEKHQRSYGYNDPLLTGPPRKWTLGTFISLALALMFLVGVWLALDQKLLFGKDWISETYDNEDWRTNEGNLHTYGAWDLEAHIWKTEYIRQNFPHFHWNPYWYLGMPLLKYYQSGFYFIHIAFIELTNLSAARTALLMIIFSHLLATLLTFLVCYKVSKRIWASALASSFVLSNTFITLRSYGWEPITVIFLFLYPLGLLLFLKEPLRPFRFWLIVVTGIAYVSHPLLWFSLCMFMGLYLFSIAIRHQVEKNAQHGHYILQFVAVVFCSLLIGAFQFLPQIAYTQATSGAHMGVKYLPFYQVPPNIITLQDFFFNAGNLKGPGPIIMISFLLLLVLGYIHYVKKNNYTRKLHDHELIVGITLVLFTMVLFYYMELYNIFPMNILRSIQYHRIIPEFVITAAVLVAVMSNVLYSYKQKVVYYSMLATFVLVSGIIVYHVQDYWQTTTSIAQKPEFIYDSVPGRISFPYTDQSLAVRNSFTFIPQTYGYYEQGITNAFNDEVFSVSSGFHNADLTLLYLKAANVGRLYVNLQEGERDRIMMNRINQSLPFVRTNNTRYAYFEVPLANANFVQALDGAQAQQVQKSRPLCRVMFQDRYCGSFGEEFVSTDVQEVKYLRAYNELLEQPYTAKATMMMINPDNYQIKVQGADPSTVIVVKMTYDEDFEATVNDNEISIVPFGPDFMLLAPSQAGDYTIHLEYGPSMLFRVGVALSLLTLLALALFSFTKRYREPWYLSFNQGDMK